MTFRPVIIEKWMYIAKVPLDNALVIMRSFSVTSANIAINDISINTRFFGLYFCRRQYRSIFDHFDVMGPKSYRIR